MNDIADGVRDSAGVGFCNGDRTNEVAAGEKEAGPWPGVPDEGRICMGDMAFCGLVMDELASAGSMVMPWERSAPWPAGRLILKGSMFGDDA